MNNSGIKVWTEELTTDQKWNLYDALDQLGIEHEIFSVDTDDEDCIIVADLEAYFKTIEAICDVLEDVEDM